MKKKILALYDSEADYLEGMSSFLQEQNGFPFELHAYTEKDKLLELGKQERIDLLLVAESDFTYEVAGLDTGKTLLLNESGLVREEKLRNIDKYQKAERVWQELLDSYASMLPEGGKQLGCTENTKLIGLYSPVRRCLQTSFALTLGQALAENEQSGYNYKSTPMIMLKGAWLRNCGFEEGDHISAKCEGGRLTITRVDEYVVEAIPVMCVIEEAHSFQKGVK